jgi:hypothetical protein
MMGFTTIEVKPSSNSTARNKNAEQVMRPTSTGSADGGDR